MSLITGRCQQEEATVSDEAVLAERPAALRTTYDPLCWIEDRGADWVRYINADGQRWVILGTCNCCGLCEVGAADAQQRKLVWRGNPGEPGACVSLMDPRTDVPVRPEISRLEGCVLSGYYL